MREVVELVRLPALTLVVKAIDGHEFHMELVGRGVSVWNALAVERRRLLERITHASTDAAEIYARDHLRASTSRGNERLTGVVHDEHERVRVDRLRHVRQVAIVVVVDDLLRRREERARLLVRSCVGREEPASRSVRVRRSPFVTYRNAALDALSSIKRKQIITFWRILFQSKMNRAKATRRRKNH